MAATGTGSLRLPGLAQTLGFAWIYLAALVLLPLAALVFKATNTSSADLWAALSGARLQASLRLSIGAALIASVFNVFAGALVAWVLARYEFRGRALLDAIVDLPFALPTAVAGITLAFLYSESGWLGQWLAHVGIKVAFTPLGVTLALAFVGFPFVVRTIQPVIESFEPELEEAARAMGAPSSAIFWRVHLPMVAPAAATGFALCLARTLGEYGSVLFISGNLPFRTEIAPLLVVARLEEYDYTGAAVLACILLGISLLLTFAAQTFERAIRRRFAVEADA